MKRRNIAAVTWFIAFFCIELADSFLGMEAIFLWLALDVYTAGLMIVLLFNAVASKKLSVLYPAIFIIAAIAVFRVTPLGSVSVYLRLFAEENEYLRAIEAAVAGNNQQCEKLRCIIEDKDKEQVAFEWDGIIGDWYGICHDPTATVLNANIADRNDPEYEKAAGMFDGTMIGAEHLWGDWYLCNFT